jgi:cobalt-zinc-cadmium efflux system outer membrane protein
MAPPVKQGILRALARWTKEVGLIGTVAICPLSQGCSWHSLGTSGPEQVLRPTGPEAAIAATNTSSASSNGLGSTSVQLASFDQPNPTSPTERAAKNDQPENAAANPSAKQPITLPMAIAMCVNNNFRVLAGAERTHLGEADLLTSSLIPNPSLFADCQLIPLQNADIKNQLGPPQWDALVTFPIDWLLFGKRLAGMQASRLGIEVLNAESANVLRTQLAKTVDAFYEVVMDDAYFKLAEQNLQELTEFEKLTQELEKNKKVGPLDLDRVKLAVHEALLDRHDRELALDIAKAQLRPFLGRTAEDGDYEVRGDLNVTAMVPPPKLEEALALAEAHRPDLLAGRKAIDQAHAVVELERRRAKPQIAIQPGWTYQDQAHQTAFRNGSMLDIGISTTLPLTDRNQGNIRRAEVMVQERHLTYLADRADILAEVEAARASYDDAVEHLTLFNTPETLKAAYDLRKNMEAAYRAGDRKLIELLDAQKAYQSRLAHTIEFKSDYWRTLNKLNAAVGLTSCDSTTGPTAPFTKQVDK